MPRSPLHDTHKELGARFVDFAGWEMPVQYEGVLAEHQTVREGVGVFDVSHLGRFQVEGPGSTQLLLSLLCNDITEIEPGGAQYTMSLNDRGGVLDDIIVWRWERDRYWVIPNGANDDAIRSRFAAAAPGSVTIASIREDTAMLAIQGPDAPGVFDEVFGVMPEHFKLAEADFRGVTVHLAGTGYTGEIGGEVAIDRSVATEAFDAIMRAGAKPCGLGSRDTLRLEMGYPLWGQDLDPDTTPLEARLGWVIGWEHEFVGRKALERQRAEGLPKRLVGFEMEGRQIARHGYPMRSGVSEGVVSSGNFSPVLGHGIGMGYLAPPVDSEAPLQVQIRGNWIPVQQTRPPFIRRR